MVTAHSCSRYASCARARAALAAARTGAGRAEALLLPAPPHGSAAGGASAAALGAPWAALLASGAASSAVLAPGRRGSVAQEGRGGSSDDDARRTGTASGAPVAAADAADSGTGTGQLPSNVQARRLTQQIASAQNWPQLAAVVHAAGGVQCLNEIHLSAALARLAKLDLAPPRNGDPLQRQPEHQLLQAPAAAVSFPAAAASSLPLPLPPPLPLATTPLALPRSFAPSAPLPPLPPPPAPLQLTTLKQPTGIGDAAAMRFLPAAQLASPPSQRPEVGGAAAVRHATPAANTAGPLPPASPEALYIGLLEELAYRFDAQKRSTSLSTDNSARATIRTPPTARVLANGTWAAARLLLQLRRTQQHRALVAQLNGAGPAAAAAAAPQHADAHASRALRALLGHVPGVARWMEPQHCSNLLYTLARLEEEAPDVLARVEGASGGGGGAGAAGGCGGAEDTNAVVGALLHASGLQLAAFGPQALANSIYALACLGVRPPAGWLPTWVAAAALQLPRADAQHVSNMLWALARLQHHPGDAWLLAALQAAAVKLPAFTPQGLCTTLWALAKLGYAATNARRATALHPMLAGVCAAAGGCGPQDVSNGLWAVAQLHRLLSRPSRTPPSSPPAPLDKEAADDVNRATAAALAKAGAALLRRSGRQLAAYSPQQLANTAWAAATLRLAPPPEWRAQFWGAALRALPVCRTEELVAIAQASAQLPLPPPPEWLEAMLQLTGDAMRQAGAADDARASTHGAAPRPPGPQLAPAVLRFEPTGRALSTLLQCMAEWQVRPTVDWMAAVLLRLRELARSGQLEGPSLVVALHALAAMRLRPDRVVDGWTCDVLDAHVAATAAEQRRTMQAASSKPEQAAGGEDVSTSDGGRQDAQEGSPGSPLARTSTEGRARTAPGARQGHLLWPSASAAAQAQAGWTAVEADCLAAAGYSPDVARMVLFALVRLRVRPSTRAAGVFALAAARAGGPRRMHVPAGDEPARAALQTLEAPYTAAAADGVCVALWALDRMCCEPDRPVMLSLERAVAAAAPTMSRPGLVSTYAALAGLGFRPGRACWHALEACALRLAGGMAAAQVAELLAASVALRRRPGRDVVDALVARWRELVGPARGPAPPDGGLEPVPGAVRVRMQRACHALGVEIDGTW